MKYWSDRARAVVGELRELYPAPGARKQPITEASLLTDAHEWEAEHPEVDCRDCGGGVVSSIEEVVMALEYEVEGK